jgi:hypothetical protein
MFTTYISSISSIPQSRKKPFSFNWDDIIQGSNWTRKQQLETRTHVYPTILCPLHQLDTFGTFTIPYSLTPWLAHIPNNHFKNVKTTTSS